MASYFSNPLIQAPIGFICAIPLLEHNVIVLSEEMQLAGCFMVFVSTVYTQFGDMIGEALDAKGKSIIEEHNAMESVTIDAIKSLIKTHENNLTLIEDMAELDAIKEDMLKTLCKAKAMEVQYTIRSEYIRKLDYLAAKEDTLKAKQQVAVATKAAESVKAEFLSSKELQTQALTQAIDAIVNPSKAGTDVVGKAFSSYLQGYVASVKSLEGKEIDIPDEVFAEAKADMMALRVKDLPSTGTGDFSSFPTADGTDFSGLPKKMIL